MRQLQINNQTLAMCKSQLTYSADELAFFTEALVRSTQDVNLYSTAPPAEADPDTITARAETAGGDWAQMVHPYVLAQLVVDIAERASLPLPDNVFIYVFPTPDHGGGWEPVSMVAPSQVVAPPATLPVAPPAPPAPPVATPVATPAAPAALAAPLIDLDGTLATLPVTAAAPVSASPVHTGEYLPAEQAPPATAAAPQPQAPIEHTAAQPQPQQQEIFYGLPAFEFTLPVGPNGGRAPASAFAKDPKGEIPKMPPTRFWRDIVEMAPHLLSTTPAQVVGQGKGQTQRVRQFMAATKLFDLFLASVGDKDCTVGYLQHHLAHLRYHTSQTAAGPTLIANEQYLFNFSPDAK